MSYNERYKYPGLCQMRLAEEIREISQMRFHGIFDIIASLFDCFGFGDILKMIHSDGNFWSKIRSIFKINFQYIVPDLSQIWTNSVTVAYISSSSFWIPTIFVSLLPQKCVWAFTKTYNIHLHSSIRAIELKFQN